MKGDELVGRMVTVTNPDLNSRWSGVAVAVSHHPAVLVEEPGTGRRFMLPLAWASLPVGVGVGGRDE